MARDPGARCVGHRRAASNGADREAGLKAPTLPAQTPQMSGLPRAGGMARSSGRKSPRRGCRKATRWGGKPPRHACGVGTRAPVAPSPAPPTGLQALEIPEAKSAMAAAVADQRRRIRDVGRVERSETRRATQPGHVGSRSARPNLRDGRDGSIFRRTAQASMLGLGARRHGPGPESGAVPPLPLQFAGILLY